MNWQFGGGHGRRGRRRAAVMAEINVTPMVDVMLVLLIIFMVSAPLMTVGVPIDLPQTQAKTPRRRTRSRCYAVGRSRKHRTSSPRKILISA